MAKTIFPLLDLHEDFKFLSVKQIPTLLLLNKSTHGQLVQSERFWKGAAFNYARAFSLELPVEDLSTADLPQSLRGLIEEKQSKIHILQQEIHAAESKASTYRAQAAKIKGQTPSAMNLFITKTYESETKELEMHLKELKKNVQDLTLEE
ncbi:predicted protein [Naegleria gruberi]|uniref:Predicted protein n=1 Tax=Naegleria gruberi TaxID=5762 RepID=D2VUG9_NAEGR|nr:uncharacterized protein NAEGRDRAFT_72659 [Naegleria gruberi]EFC39447.1 predicted protein [Naegleria gruberi]|eukprot:XP_002672191.1 predicted protein [Naegleria gruberi strain NEG-M]